MKNKPSDYYFCAADEDFYGENCCYEDMDPPLVPGVDATVFYICPKDHYDSTGHLYDGCVMNEVSIPKGFSECMEGCYEAALPLDKARKVLSDAGFVEKYIGPPWGKKLIVPAVKNKAKKMTSGECKKLIAGYFLKNKSTIIKKWKNKPPPPSDETYRKSVCVAKNWKRESKKTDEFGNIVRVFVGCAGSWYDDKSAGWPRLLKATIVERNGELVDLKIRKY